jgi:hypothetical protein
MTWPRVSLDKLKKVRAWEHAIRFVFGGAVTAIAGLVGSRWGEAVGGMFLAFPAILPASLTLVKQHGSRADAVDDARGGRVGTLALAGFAVVVAVTATILSPAVFLSLAMAAWLVVAVFGWRVFLAS